MSRSDSKPPALARENPGKGASVRVNFSRDGRDWTEEVNFAECLASVLEATGQALTRHSDWIELDDGLILQPLVVSMQLRDDNGIASATTVAVSHPVHIPGSGVFEYQHSAGDDVRQALTKGFKGWAGLDLPVLRDALKENPKNCNRMEISLPAGGSLPARNRRALLGPIQHLAQKPAPQSPEPEEHPFCPCCLFTSLGEAVKSKLCDNGFHAIRLYAMRNEDGTGEADCRVNGIDWPEGKEALTKYVSKWPDRGFELRKQYVIIQDA